MGKKRSVKWGGIWLLAVALAFALGACRTQEGPVVQEKKENREQTGTFEIQGLEVRTFSGLNGGVVLDATSATMDLANKVTFLNQVEAQYTSGTRIQTLRSGSGVYYNRTPAKNQTVPEYFPGVRPQKGDVYLQGGVDIDDRGQTIKAPSLYYLRLPTGAPPQVGKAPETTTTIVSAGGDVEFGMPNEKGGRVLVEAKGFKMNASQMGDSKKNGSKRQEVNFEGPVSLKTENATTSTQSATTVTNPASVAAPVVAPVAEPKAEVQAVRPALPPTAPKAGVRSESAGERKPVLKAGESGVKKPAAKTGNGGSGKKSASKPKPKVEK
jgi:hypothetical protein